MRPSSGPAAVLVMALAACGGVRLTGSGVTETRTPEVDAFASVVLGSAFVGYVSVGGEASVAVTADDNVWEHIVVSVRQGVLSIGLAQGVTLVDATLEAVITVPVLHAVAARGAAQAEVWTGRQTDPITVIAEGAGTISGSVEAPYVSIRVSDSGSLSLTGKTDLLELYGDGAGKADLGALEAESAGVTLSGASEATVWAVDSLFLADLSGASALVVLGGPEITGQDISGAASLTER